jgi:Ca-activated chloride channel homolog
MPVSGKAIIAASVLCLVAAGAATVSGPVGRAAAQSGREREARPAEASLNVIVQSDQGVTSEPLQLTPNQCALYEAGIQQEILSLRPDLSAARIVLLVDNSQNVGLETSEMEATTRALIRELFTGDQLMIIGYGAEPEILNDFTADATKLVASAKMYRKAGRPRLFNALAAVLEDALRPAATTTKRVIVLVSDGYDDGSETSYDKILAALQNENVVIYGVQAADRTYGAPRNKKLGPKPPEALRGFVEGTGGRMFKPDAPDAMKLITDEIRNRWFELTYAPKGANTTLDRRLLLSPNEENLVLRTKKMQPAK